MDKLRGGGWEGEESGRGVIGRWSISGKIKVQETLFLRSQMSNFHSATTRAEYSVPIRMSVSRSIRDRRKYCRGVLQKLVVNNVH